MGNCDLVIQITSNVSIIIAIVIAIVIAAVLNTFITVVKIAQKLDILITKLDNIIEILGRK